MKAGTYKDGELWLRCPICGDSRTDPHKAHFSVNLTGLYHCLKCNCGGKLRTSKLIELYSGHLEVFGPEPQVAISNSLAYIYDRLLPGPWLTRHSYLERFHLDEQDVFLSYNGQRDIVGLAFVGQSQRSLIGRKMIGWNRVNGELTSSEQDPLILVEGPYDVIDRSHVCTFGIPTVNQIQQTLMGQFIVLCPDGDVWTNLRQVQHIRRLVQNCPLILGAQVLPEDRDPDQMAPSSRPYLSRQELLQQCTDFIKSRGYSY